MGKLKLCCGLVGLYAGSAQAQPLQSQMYVPRAELSLGGSLRMGEDTSDSGSFSTSKSISISSSYLWFMGESFELGPEFTYSGQWRKNPSYRYHSWSIGVGPRLKYNLADVNRSTVIPYGVAGIQISTGNSDISTPANKNTGDQSYLGMGITFPVRATAAIYLECQYNWAHSKSKYDVPAGSNDDGIEVDSSRDLWTLLGVNLYL